MNKTVRASCADLFCRDQAKIEHSVMVRAQHDDVFQVVCATGFAGNDVCNVARCFSPVAQRTAVYKSRTDHPPEGAGAGVDAVSRSAASHGLRVADSKARPIAVNSAFAHLRRQAFNGFSASTARRGRSGYPGAPWVSLLMRELAGISAKSRFGACSLAFAPRKWSTALFARRRCIITPGCAAACFAAPPCSCTGLNARTPRDLRGAIRAGLARYVPRASAAGHGISIQGV